MICDVTATLFSTIGTTFGVGDGSSTFNLPDLRSEFIRGWDDGRGIDASRLFGSAQAATAIRVLIDNYLNYPIGTYAVGMRNVDESLRGSGNQNRTIGSDNNFYTNPATINLGSDDNQAFTVRPRNIALLACIKY